MPRLGDLVGAILAHFPDLPRLRLSSLDGVEIDDRLFEILTGEPRVMPHIHLSLQSGDDMVLKRMKRRHSRGQALSLIERLRLYRPDIAIGADIIAGFPTETEAMHANNLSLIAAAGIVHGHIFPYSPRPGTPAARMPAVDPAQVRERAAQLREAVAAERAVWLHGLIGRPREVLAERDGTGHSPNSRPIACPRHGTGRACHPYPDDDQRRTAGMSSDTWSDRLLGGLRKTQERLSGNLAGLVGANRLSDEQLDDIEDALIASDLGPRGRPHPRAPRLRPLRRVSTKRPCAKLSPRKSPRSCVRWLARSTSSPSPAHRSFW
jgi:hypothetical protein